VITLPRMNGGTCLRETPAKLSSVCRGRKEGVRLSITQNSGPSDSSQFQIRQTRESSPHHHITWCWIPCSIQVAAASQSLSGIAKVSWLGAPF
jgi:hypothetical protein